MAVLKMSMLNSCFAANQSHGGLVIEVRLTAQTAGNSADSGIPDGNYHSRQGW
ncbi:hypothetical protein [Escherichia coli]|uniref:hypothetical protein n=1 Tax=Escherichia coli TaxID=562 RepID=UPI00147C69C8|nr:hypothetical protein [Escherichia coli]